MDIDYLMPAAIPHATTEEDVYNGYHIPKGAIVVPNIWLVLQFFLKIHPLLSFPLLAIGRWHTTPIFTKTLPVSIRDVSSERMGIQLSWIPACWYSASVAGTAQALSVG